MWMIESTLHRLYKWFIFTEYVIKKRLSMRTFVGIRAHSYSLWLINCSRTASIIIELLACGKSTRIHLSCIYIALSIKQTNISYLRNTTFPLVLTEYGYYNYRDYINTSKNQCYDSLISLTLFSVTTFRWCLPIC